MKLITFQAQEVVPGVRPCISTASNTTPNVACPRPARWHAVLQYERPGSPLVPARAEWFACDAHLYPVAQHQQCCLTAQDGMSDLIANAEKRFAASGPLR